jgi:PAS domain S-box-containing protein
MAKQKLTSSQEFEEPGKEARKKYHEHLESLLEKQARELKNSELNYRNFVENAIEGIFRVSPYGRLLSANPAMARMYGVETSEEMIRCATDTAKLWVRQEDRKRFLALLKREGQVRNYEAEFYTKDGERKWFCMALWTVKDDNGNNLHYDGTIEEVTAGKHTERSLRESEERFRLIFDQSPLGAVISTLDRRFVTGNEAICRITGYTADELKGKSFEEITHPDDLPANMSFADHLLSGKLDYYEMEKRYIRKDGKIVWVHLYVSAVRDNDGKPRYVSVLVQDITERKTAEEKYRAPSV